MKARDAARAAILVKALGKLEKLEGVLKNKAPEMAVDIWIGQPLDEDDAVEIDRVTARHCIPHIRKEIEDELKRMGVEL